MARCVRPQHCLLLALLLPTALWAQGSFNPSQDPTRPAYVDMTSAGAAEQGSVSRLSSIVVPKGKGARPYAVIDGVVVYVGGIVGDARLQQIKESAVVLKSDSGTETLLLTPSVQKKFTQQTNATKRSDKAMPPIRDPS